MDQINSIQNLQTNALTNYSPEKQVRTPGESQAAFAKSLNNAINQLNETQKASDAKTEALAKGEIDDLHDVMITAQKASITLTTAVEVQRKALDAYNEMMRMQV